MALSPLAVSVLGLLLERAMHPYELFQLMLTRGEDRIVKVRPGTLYHTVARLAEAGLIRPIGTERAGNRPERTTYEITADGRIELQDWVRVALAVPVNEFPRLPLAISEAHNLPAAEAAGLLDRRLVALRGSVAEWAGALDRIRAKGVPERYTLDVAFLHRTLVAEHDFIQDLVDRIRGGDLDWPDPSGEHTPKGTS